VLVAFASDPFDAMPVWTDITGDVRRVMIKRGRQTQLDRMEAGTAIIELKNFHGNYWPLNATSPHYPYVKPNKLVQIRSAYNGVPYYLYTGFAESWKPSWLSASGGQKALMRLQCADLIKRLARYDLNTAGYAQELSGTRVGNVLDDVGWPAGARDLDIGQSQMQATGAIADKKAMSHLFTVQDSELGIIYVAGNGDVQFEDRYHRLKAPHTVSQAIFGDDLGENYYHDVEPDYDDQFIYNDIRITRDGGTQQPASDAPSKTAYGPNTYSKTGLLMTTDNEALDQAQYLLKMFKDPLLRPSTLKILGERDPANLWPKLLGYDISTRITLRLNQATIDKDFFIEGVTHDINVKDGTWGVSWELSNVDEQQYWALGVAGLGELGVATYLAY